MSLAKKLRDMHEAAHEQCDPEYNRALLEAADEIERLHFENEKLREALHHTVKAL